MFCFKKAAKILGCHYNTMPSLLNEQGILIKKIGRKKMVSALELAKIMYSNQESPVNNDRGYRLARVK